MYLGTLWLRDSQDGRWEQLARESSVELRRDRTLVARDVVGGARLTLRLERAMANEEAVRIEMSPPGVSRLGQLRAIFTDERTGNTTLTIDALDPSRGVLPR